MTILSRAQGWYKHNQHIIQNISSLVWTTFTTSGIGFLYWWLTARLYSSSDVGFAAAAISAMTLLGTIGIVGLGTVLIGEVARKQYETGVLLTTALLFVSITGFLLGCGFAILAPSISRELAPLSASLTTTVLFASGVAATTIGLVLDQALIGLLRGNLQLWRNMVYALLKLILLILFAHIIEQQSGIWIYTTWTIGNILSLASVTVVALLRRDWTGKIYRPDWRLLWTLGKKAFQHHLLNLTLQVPGLTLPIVVTALLSTAANSHFYVAWMIASLLMTVPIACSTVLYAVGSADPLVIAQKIRFTLNLSLIVGGVGSLTLFFGSEFFLRIFGVEYAQEAAWPLRLLALGVFPFTIRTHYIAIRRISNQILKAVLLTSIGGLLELALGGIGAYIGHLPGLSLGWLLAVCIEAIIMGAPVYRIAFPSKAIYNNQATTSNSVIE